MMIGHCVAALFFLAFPLSIHADTSTVVTCQTVDPTNLLTNPSWESGTSGWTYSWIGGSPTTTSADSTDGSFSLVQPGTISLAQTYQTVDNLVANAPYWFSVDFRGVVVNPNAPTSRVCYIYLVHDDALTTNIIEEQVEILSLDNMEWQTLSGTYTPPSSSLVFRVVFNCVAPASSRLQIYIDNAIMRAETPSQECTTVTATASSTISSATSTSISSTISAASSTSSLGSSSTSSTSSSSPSPSSTVSSATSASTSSSSSSSSSTTTPTSSSSASTPVSSSTTKPTISSSIVSSTNSPSTKSSTSSSTIKPTTSSSSTRTSSSASLPTPLTVQSALNGACVYSGCYTEATNIRALSKATHVNYTNMSVEICAKNCEGYQFFGLEWSGECYCGDSLGPGSVPAPTTDCNMVCDGHPLELCGAGDRLTLYNCTLPAAASTLAVPTVGKYSYYGCQTEATNTRALSLKATAYDTMTLESCAADCAGYDFFGTEFARECYCGNSLNAGSIAAPPSDCSMQCAGNSTELCGSSLRLSVYELKSGGPAIVPTIGAYNYHGCYTEGTSLRALASKATAYDTMTLESCAQDCTGYTYFGTEYSRECYCGNDFSAGSVPVADVTCSSPCAGNMLEFCGGSKLLTVYQHS